MVATYKIETLEMVIAPGKGSLAYKAGYYTGKAINWAITLGGLIG
ncbi:hypothetical protein JOC77_000167 [Peribacillus deserti]|uniref:Uncharacterized protein n=1 Tax=Peribacillus deserti TaxID=673318 RepID=A0ABS2QD69_9BACI|nr:hypothetical protein [Peribacillus deserti]MBM7690764.1 hypothetical protein [Peribacillus deserti]